IRKYGWPHILNGTYVEFFEEMELNKIREHAYETSWFKDYIASSRYPYIVGSGTCVLRRDALTSVRFLEDRLNAEDHDLILQLVNLSGFVQIVAPVTLAGRRHSASQTGNFFSSVSGAKRLLAHEKLGRYPGGPERSNERHRIISRHTRPVALACVRS